MELDFAVPAGCVGLMRRLDAGAAPAAAERACLVALRDVYGAAAEADGGWRLCYAPQWLSLPPMLSGLPVSVADEVDSTQRVCRALEAPRVVVAEHQSGGVGRRGRGWLGLPGDAVTLSLSLPVPAAVAGLSVALGAMLCGALSDEGLRFKWPNDVVDARRRKVAGILTEVVGGRLVVGVGVNWRMTATLAARVRAAGGYLPAGLCEAAPRVSDRSAAVARVVQTVVRTVDSFADGFAPFRAAAAAAHVAAVGEALRVDGAESVFVGFDDDGALRTRRGRHVSGGVQYVACG